MADTDPHPQTSDHAYADLVECQDRLRTGDWTSRELATRLLERMDAVDEAGPALRAVLARTAGALDEADQRDRQRRAGELVGPLHGVPVLVKDNIEAIGLPGTAGSLALAGRPVTGDAPVVTALRRAGAVVLGATNLSEWANFRSPHSTSGWSAVGGLTGNPWALDRSAGGSSSGSGAAVAAGLAPLALGTETNGSITCPAALNGLVGLKPTVGTLSAEQVVPISGSQDVPGPLTRCVDDAALAYAVLSGRPECLPDGLPDPRSLRIGTVGAWDTGHERTDALAHAIVFGLRDAVASITEVAMPSVDGAVMADQVAVLVAEMSDDLGAYLRRRPGPGASTVAELVDFNAEHAETELAFFGQEFLEQAARSPGRNGDEYREARQRNLAFALDACLGPAYDTVDLLVAPAYQPAWKSDLVLGDLLAGGGAVATPPAILGWPILTVPLGLVDGLPVGLSITGPARSEPALLAVGRLVESVVGWAGTPASRPAWRPAERG
ncbi:MAG: amidase [Actinomycetales bacterium]|nr:amidase [Actinomycetales bacterium]